MHINKTIKIILLFGLLSVLLNQCSEDDAEIPQTENEVFNQLLQEAPATIIELDAIPVDTVTVTSEQILGRETSSFFSKPVFLKFFTTSFLKIKDSLYVSSMNKIYVMDNKGVWQRSIGRKGQGPGEFASSAKLARNSKYIIVFDYWNGRIQVFDHDLNLLFILNKNLHDSLILKNYALTEDHLFLELNPHINEKLIGVYRVDELDNEIETFWPVMIPNSLQPASYNSIIIDINTHEDIAITNYGLPYLFLLNPDREIRHIIYFESSYYRESENPSTKPVKVEGNTEQSVPGVKAFIRLINIMDDGSIYFNVGNNLYRIISDENDTYHLNKAWHFVHSEPHLREEYPKGVDFGGMIIDDGTFYFIPLKGGYVYRVPLD